MDGISQFNTGQKQEEIDRIKQICDGTIKGIVSNQITKGELDALKSEAKKCKTQRVSTTCGYTRATYTIASYRGASLSVKGRRFMRTKGLQGRAAAVYMRGLIITNFST